VVTNIESEAERNAGKIKVARLKLREMQMMQGKKPRRKRKRKPASGRPRTARRVFPKQRVRTARASLSQAFSPRMLAYRVRTVRPNKRGKSTTAKKSSRKSGRPATASTRETMQELIG
jgi:hypothetical protein